MPGLKRKASQPAPSETPPKLKKQTTSSAVDKGKSTAVPKKKGIPESPPRLKKARSENKQKQPTPKKSPAKPAKLPRFPTLKPTGTIGADGPDFSFSVPKFYKKSASKPNLKKDPTLILKENSESVKEKVLKKSASKGPTMELSSQPTEILPPGVEVDPGSTRASAIEKKVQILPSGSTLGKITNLAFGDDLTLPSDASLAIYEFSEESSSTSFGATPGKLSGSSPESRTSANAVSDYFATSDGTKDFGFSDEEFISGENTPTEKTDSNSQTKESATNGTPSKSPRKVPGGLREIVFSFDTTGSMYNYMEEAAERIKDLVSKLQEEIPGIRLAFIAHGDYYDLKQDRYLIKWLDFGASMEEVVKFFENLNITHGGDADECYELALRKVRESLSWTPGSQRCLVMIGDSDPHEPGYKFEEFINDIDWRVEAGLLRDMGVRIYGMQVGYRSDFYRQISQITGGAHLRIDNASFTHDMLMAICLREGSLKLLKSYENEVRKVKKDAGEVGLLDLGLERLFSSLKSIDDNKSSKVKMKLKLQSEKEEQKEDTPIVTAMPVKRPSENVDQPGAASPEEPSPKKKKVQKFEPLTPKIIKERKKKEKEERKAEKATKKNFTKLKEKKKEGVGKSTIKQTKIKAEKSLLKKPGRTKKVDISKDSKSEGKKKRGPKPSGKKGETKSQTLKSVKQVQVKKPPKKTVTKKSMLQVKKSRSTGKSDKGKESTKDAKAKKGTPQKMNKAAKTPKKVVTKRTSIKNAASKSNLKKSEVPKKAIGGKGRQSTKDSKQKDTKKMSTPKKGSPKLANTTSSKGKKSPGRPKVTKVTKPQKVEKISSKKAEAIKKVFKSKSPGKEPVVVKRKEAPATKIIKKETKSPSKPVIKQMREAASVIKFAMPPLNSMFWDDWATFILPEKPVIKSDDWKKCPGWCPGYYNTTLYNDSDKVTGVIEIAVSPPGRKKHYAVYFNIKSLWDCFDSPRVKKEVDRVIKKKGSICIRRGILKKSNDAAFQRVVEYLVENFDYAWEGRSGEVLKDGFCISASS